MLYQTDYRGIFMVTKTTRLRKSLILITLGFCLKSINNYEGFELLTNLITRDIWSSIDPVD